MPKFLLQGSYTTEGLKGLVQEGGSQRRAAVEKLVQSLGGTLEGYYFAFGADDVFAVVDLPDTASAAAAALAVGSSGAARVRTVVLITPEEMDRAVALRAEYRPPAS